MATVELRDVRKRFGTIEVVHGVDLAIADGEFVVLVGPSGCGKSTLLRMIAGLEDISSGDLFIGDARANDLPPQRRDVAMVFQSYALFPHMTVAGNIGYGLRVRGDAPDAIAGRVGTAAGTLNLSAFLERRPAHLSGGQRQRVAMGRAMVRDPRVFLFDEPLSNLDAKLRVQMRAEIKAMHRRIRTTTVYVTHDQIEAMTLADRVVAMRDGRIEQIGGPLDLYDRPANLFVAGFIGSPAMSFVPGTLRRTGETGVVEIPGSGCVPAPPSNAADGQPVILGIRPEAFEIVEDGDGLPAEIDLVEPTGAETHLYGRLGEHDLRIVLHRRVGVRPGDQVRLRADPAGAHLFDVRTEHRL
ncbi:ABC transporter ATP-binding protein [Marinivivus vitaminiproducens]|uniref:ABC transporter ATP-binding protein n=1 Tax=Marinivivus vitaminiproducens TaxID=3035935 RepID=UPI002798A084|nr:sn-glycerol-3-phosphate ABC transporter ATP-binding protein UgpC [Geminicoccaceae bacterium SCSIO 64248]